LRGYKFHLKWKGYVDNEKILSYWKKILKEDNKLLSWETSWELPDEDSDFEHTHHIAWLLAPIETHANYLFLLGEEGTNAWCNTIRDGQHYIELYDWYLKGFKKVGDTMSFIEPIKLFEGPKLSKENAKGFWDSVLDFIKNENNWQNILEDKKYGAYLSTKKQWTREVWDLNHKYDWKRKLNPKINEDGSNMFGTQKRMWTIVKENENDSRKIIWFYDEIGNTGKSQLTEWICKYHWGMPGDGKGQDIMYAWDDAYKYVIFDLVRKKEEFVSYATMERMRNGLFFSGKYHSTIKAGNIVIVVFANYLPDPEAFSKD